LTYLRQVLPVDAEPTLSVQPDWLTRVPWMAFRISVVETDEAAEVARALPGS
jgi:hypothetical protein